MNPSLSLIPLNEFPLVKPGDDVANIIVGSLEKNKIKLQPKDLVIVAQKIISKAENRYVTLVEVEPGEQARELAVKVEKDPRLVELILRESNRVVRFKPGVLIVEHRLGFVLANAGIDQSNLPGWDSEPRALLLPENPDGSAAQIREKLEAANGAPIGVIVNDSVGRAWRIGTVGIAIGSAGIAPLNNLVGKEDLFGRELKVTEIAVADELAAAASFVMGQAAEGCPVVIVRGASWLTSNDGSGELIRESELDLFR